MEQAASGSARRFSAEDKKGDRSIIDGMAARMTDGTASYAYDSAGQLTAATYSYQANESYSFDSTGNRTNTATARGRTTR